jgi:hypothetical protein
LAGAVYVLDRFPGNQVLGSVGAREVVGTSVGRDSQARFDLDGTAVVSRLGGSTARLTAEAVELPGGRVVHIPAGCLRVETRKGLCVLFNGVEAN